MNRRKTVLKTLLSAAVAAGVAATLAQATVSASSAKNGQIVYRHFHSLFVVNADGTGERKLTKPPGGKFVDDQPDWSPDGSTIPPLTTEQRLTGRQHQLALTANPSK